LVSRDRHPSPPAGFYFVFDEGFASIIYSIPGYMVVVGVDVIYA